MTKHTRLPKRAKKVLRKIARRRNVRVIKHVIRSMQETKTARFILTGGAFNIANSANSSGFATQNVLQLTPNATNLIAQGTGQGDRIGNKIRVVGARLKFSVFPNPYNATSNTVPTPQILLMWLCKSKDVASRDTANTATNALANFFNAGDSSLGMSGTVYDYTNPLNHDTFTQYGRKVYKVGAANYQTNTGTQANTYSYSNNEFKLNVISTINLLKHGFPRVIDWNDTTTLPKTNPLYLIMNSVDATGTANSSGASANPLLANMVVEIDWKDA